MKEQPLMNAYGTQAMNHWKTAAPTRYAALPDPVEFFTELGDEIQNQVLNLTETLTAGLPASEDYLERVGQVNAARMQAEEIVRADLMWIEPEISEDREEWDSTSPSDQGLVDWAIRTDPETLTTDELEDLAIQWAVPVSLLEELLGSPNPAQLFASATEIRARAADSRYQRDLQHLHQLHQ
jgi:hypothetical protein